MKEKFLKAKHWQIFLLTFAFPFFLQMVMIPVLFVTKTPELMMIAMPVVVVIYLGGLMGWLWSVAIGLQEKLPSEVQMKVTRFRFFFFYPLAFLPLLVVGIIYFAGSVAASGMEPDWASLVLGLSVILPLHLFAIFCMFYCYYFVAKTLKATELQRKVTFSDFVGEFFLLWFYPIGVWFIQPKINVLAEK